MKLPAIGQLRHRIVIESASETTDSQGGQATTWSTYATVWALLEPRGSMEARFSEQIQLRRTHICWIRYRSDLTFTSAMRILFDSRYFQIKGIRQPDERKFFLLLDLEEGVGT
jgi:SPP1 family predicted phage head-tail adaptor